MCRWETTHSLTHPGYVTCSVVGLSPAFVSIQANQPWKGILWFLRLFLCWKSPHILRNLSAGALSFTFWLVDWTAESSSHCCIHFRSNHSKLIIIGVAVSWWIRLVQNCHRSFIAHWSCWQHNAITPSCFYISVSQVIDKWMKSWKTKIHGSLWQSIQELTEGKMGPDHSFVGGVTAFCAAECTKSDLSEVLQLL